MDNSLDPKKILDQAASKSTIGGSISINDLKEMQYMGEMLTEDQLQAVRNYEMYRIEELNKLNNSGDDSAFHEKFKLLQVQANLWAFDEFLKDKYTQE